jgi:hypothetical protein
MKKTILMVSLVLAVASCGKKETVETTKVEDTLKVSVDSVKVDTVKVDSVNVDTVKVAKKA